MKIVINKSRARFGLSDIGIMHYAGLRGLTLYPEKGQFSFVTYWTVPPEDRPAPQDDFHRWSMPERAASNAAHDAVQLRDRNIARDDPHLVATVEVLGTTASGDYAKLAVVEIPDDVDWKIEKYDGLEWVAEQHRTWG